MGMGTLGAIKAHRPYVDLLDGRIFLLGLRAVLPLAVVYGTSPKAWAALVVAFASRVLGTDTCRYLFWGAPPLLLHMTVPSWLIGPALLVHLATFRRAI